MLKYRTFFDMFMLVAVVSAWHTAVFIACVRLPSSFFNPGKGRYLPKPWERGGKWYRDKLKIQLWKDKLPQHVGREGFSKTHFTQLSLEYVDEFIMETCRGEWSHMKNCLCVVVVFLMNPAPGLFFSFLILLGNLPFVCIQRYNRFRLQALRHKLLREAGQRPEEIRAELSADN